MKNYRIPDYLRFAACLFISVSFASCARPMGLFLRGGDSLDEEIRSGKLTVAVLPVIDRTYPEIKYFFPMGPDPRIIKRYPNYINIGLTFTNSLTENLWKKNSCFVVKKDLLIEKMSQMDFTDDEIFPDINTRTAKSRLKKPDILNSEESPDFQKLYSLGSALKADILIVTRVSGTTDNRYSFYEPNLRDTVRYRYFSKNIIILDVIFLDIRKKQVIASGWHSIVDQISEENRNALQQNMTLNLLWYLPKPDAAVRLKQSSINAATLLLSQGVPIRGKVILSFEGGYELTDDTWRSYPPGYFEENYKLSPSEYRSMFRSDSN